MTTDEESEYVALTGSDRGFLTISDDAGNSIQYPWPEGTSILHGHKFADMMIADFEARTES